jgi:hypothetical protein
MRRSCGRRSTPPLRASETETASAILRPCVQFAVDGRAEAQHVPMTQGCLLLVEQRCVVEQRPNRGALPADRRTSARVRSTPVCKSRKSVWAANSPAARASRSASAACPCCASTVACTLRHRGATRRLPWLQAPGSPLSTGEIHLYGPSRRAPLRGQRPPSIGCPSRSCAGTWRS